MAHLKRFYCPRPRSAPLCAIAFLICFALAQFSQGEIDPNLPPKSKPAATAPATSRPAAPAVMWEFNEGKDSLITDSANGTLGGKIVGGPEWVAGRQSGAMRFDGHDDYVEIGTSLPDAEAISVEAWFKLDAEATGVNTLLCDGDAASEADFWLAVEPESVLICASKDGKPLGDGKTNGNQSFERILLDRNLQGKWVHLVWTMSDAKSVIYLDGKPAGTIGKAGSNVGNHNAHPTIGCFSVGSGKGDAKRPPSKFFNGVIDSIRLYPEALSEEQVAELFAGPAKPAPIARRRRALPTPVAIENATKSVRETFKNEYAAKAADARKILGEKLMAAAESEQDMPMQFVLFREARDAFAGAGEVERSLQAAAAIAERFIVSAAEAKLEALATLVKGPNLVDNGKPIAEGALGVANVMVAAGKYTQAVKALGIADTAAKGAKNATLSALIRDRSREVREIQTQWLKVEAASNLLDTKPDDADANLRVGRFFCLVPGNWERGLPMLAKGADAKLKALAAKDLAAPTDPAGRIAVGNAWWEYVPNVPPSVAPIIKARAVVWYELAIADLDEASAARIRPRINEAQSGSKVNVLVLADPKVDPKKGKWKLSRGALAGESTAFAKYQFPYQPPEEYDLRVVITPVSGDNQVAVLFPTGTGSFALNVNTTSVSFEDPANQFFRGFRRGGGGDNLTHRLPQNLRLGQRHTVVIKVRNAGLAVYLNGEQMFKLDSDSADIRPSRAWRLDEPKCIGVGGNDTETLVHAVDVLEVRGKGTLVKPTPQEAADGR